MGRHAGWIAAAGALASDKALPLPVLILFPEIPFDPPRFLAAVQAAVRQHGYCSVVVSEGAQTADGRFLADQGVRDAFGHAQLGGAAPIVAGLIKDALGLKVHWAVADYLQRSARHLASRTDVEQAYAVGKSAVDLALKGHSAVMPTIERVANRPYRWKIGVAPLEQVANVEKRMPREYIDASGLGITPQCRKYLQPLIQGELPPPFVAGLPAYVRLKCVPVKRRLAEFKP
jgi:6-phosphofructokinase 1